MSRTLIKNYLRFLFCLTLIVGIEAHGDPVRLLRAGAVGGQDLLHSSCYGSADSLILPDAATYLPYIHSQRIRLRGSLCALVDSASSDREFQLIKKLSFSQMTSRERSLKPFLSRALDGIIDSIEVARGVGGGGVESVKVAGREAEAIFGPVVAPESGSQMDASLLIDVWAATFRNTAGLTVELDAVNSCLVAKRGGLVDLHRLGRIQPREQSSGFLLNLQARLNLDHLVRLKGYFINLIRTVVGSAPQREYLLAWIDAFLSDHQISQVTEGGNASDCRRSPDFYQWVSRYRPAGGGSMSGLDQSTLLRVCDLSFTRGSPGNINTMSSQGIGPSSSTEESPGKLLDRTPEEASSDLPIDRERLTINAFVDFLSVRLLAFSETRYGISSLGPPGEVRKGGNAESTASARLYGEDWAVPVHSACAQQRAIQGLIGAKCGEDGDAKIIPPDLLIRSAFDQARRLKDVLLSMRLHLAKVEARQKFYQEDRKAVELACARSLRNDSPEALDEIRNQRLLQQWTDGLSLSNRLEKRQLDLRWHHLKVVHRDFESMFYYATKAKKALQIDSTSRTHKPRTNDED